MSDAQKIDAIMDGLGMDEVEAFYFLMDAGELAFDDSAAHLHGD